MRFFEFTGDDAGIDKFIMALRNHVGRAASKKAPSKLNWNALNKMTTSTGFEFSADYETFNPIVQQLVKNFNADGLELNVPGAEEPGDATAQSPVKSGETSQDAVDKMAASAAPQQLASQA